MEPTWLEILKRVIVGFVTRRLLEVGGGIILTWGITSDEVGIMVAGFVAVVIGIAWSWVQTKWLARKNPDELKDFDKKGLT